MWHRTAMQNTYELLPRDPNDCDYYYVFASELVVLHLCPLADYQTKKNTIISDVIFWIAKDS